MGNRIISLYDNNDGRNYFGVWRKELILSDVVFHSYPVTTPNSDAAEKVHASTTSSETIQEILKSFSLEELEAFWQQAKKQAEKS